MKNLSVHDREFLMECLMKGQAIPQDYKETLFPVIHKEYELSYAGKMRKEDLLADQDGTYAVPLQIEKIYNGDRETYKDGWRNMIVFGDNLQFLKTVYKNEDSIIKDKIKGKVKLIYIDPPFATDEDFSNNKGQKAYTDKSKGADFIEFLRKRLILANEILADDGSIYVHMDTKKGHYIKVLMDEVFGENNFRNEICWYYPNKIPDARKRLFTVSSDFIYFYSKSERNVFNPQYDKRDAPKKRAKETKIDGKKQSVRDDDGNVMYDMYDERLVDNVWNIASLAGSSKEKKDLDYPTQKPEKLLQRIIQASTNEGDLVLDFFGGSGTTAAVAEKLNRRWVTCDIGKLSFYTIQKRLLNIQSSKDLIEPSKQYSKKAKSFVTINTGIYDLKKMQELNQDKYIEFVLQLFEVYPKERTIKGVKINGERKDGYSVLVWDYWNYKDSGIDVYFLEQLHQNIGKRIGKRFYIIAPANAVQFVSDFYEIDDVRYYFLKIPYQIIRELHPAKFAKFRQPQSRKKVNDLDNAIGFHFMLQPEVESKFSNGQLIITKFLSSFREEETEKQLANFESLSMIIVDTHFNGKDFNMTSFYFKDDLVIEKNKIIIPIGKTGKSIFVVYVDIYGNEFKEEIKTR